MPVQHKEAIEEHLAERYLLGEMSADDAERFERHYFECADCASAVEEGQVLLANGREAVRNTRRSAEIHEFRPSLWTSLQRWLSRPAGLVPVAACLLLAALAAYQNTVTIPGLRRVRDAARVVPAFQLIAASRGEGATITVPRGASSFIVSVDVPPDGQFLVYECELNSSGRSMFRLTAPAPAANQPLTILIPARELTSGMFDLVLSGVGADGQRRNRISVFPFSLRFN